MKLIINNSITSIICEEVTSLIRTTSTVLKCTLRQAINKLVTWFKCRLHTLIQRKDKSTSKHYYMLMILNHIQMRANKIK